MRPDKNFEVNLAHLGKLIDAGEPLHPVDLQMAKEVALCAFDQVQKMSPVVNCDTCYWMDKGVCRKAFKEPPEHVREKGCELWMSITTDPWDIPGEKDRKG